MIFLILALFILTTFLCSKYAFFIVMKEKNSLMDIFILCIIFIIQSIVYALLQHFLMEIGG